MTVHETANKKVIRYQNPYAFEKLYFQKGSNIVEVDTDALVKKYDCESVIKFFDLDFQLIKKDKKELTHFNIQCCDHEPDKKYLLVKIDKPGFFDGTIERPPVLNRDHFMVAKCLSVRNNLKYVELVDRDFVHSLDHIKNVVQLKETIKRRYEKSLAYLSDEEKLELGVSVTELKIIRRFSQDLMAAG